MKFFKQINDIKAFGVFTVVGLPFILSKAVLTTLPTLGMVLASEMNFETPFEIFRGITYFIADSLSHVERVFINGASLCVSSSLFFEKGNVVLEKGRNLYESNLNVIRAFERLDKKADVFTATYKANNGLSQNIRNAVRKEGLFEVFAKMVVMFSVLPAYKAAFLNNPYLFKYEIYLTNQETKPFSDTDNDEVQNMCDCVFSFIGDPTYILSQNKNKSDIDAIGFTPNYFNNVDDLNFEDHNNIGLQVGTKYTTNLYLESIHKSPEELKKCVLETTSSGANKRCKHQPNFSSVMTRKNPFYLDVVASYTDAAERDTDTDADEEPVVVNFNEVVSRHEEENRIPVLSLVIPYSSFYHPVSGKVEVNIRNGRIVEHPMLCLYHQGAVMKWTWECIEDLFNLRVMKYMDECIFTQTEEP